MAFNCLRLCVSKATSFALIDPVIKALWSGYSSFLDFFYKEILSSNDDMLLLSLEFAKIIVLWFKPTEISAVLFEELKDYSLLEYWSIFAFYRLKYYNTYSGIKFKLMILIDSGAINTKAIFWIRIYMKFIFSKFINYTRNHSR
jgi:hypothetical protein